MTAGGYGKMHAQTFPTIAYNKLKNNSNSGHSHSIILSHSNALIFQRKFFLPTVNARPLVRQIFSLLISKLKSGEFWLR
jgi:hypothetical protein